jgi:heme-degrading monooxygenase HmoA
MIARIWRGTTLASKADEYLAYLEATGIKDYRATPGNRGVQVLRRASGDEVEFVLITHWDSLDAIRAFAGDDYERAVYYDEDRAYLRERNEWVEHFEVVAGDAAEPAS